MPLSTRLHEAPIRVRYAETDAAGIAHHAAYLPWLEVGRVEWLRAAGLSYRDLEASGYSLPVIDLRVRYVAPVHFDDRLLIRTGLIDLRSRSLRFVYEIVSAAAHPRQLANGMTRHVCVARGNISPLPPELRALGE
ncbi:MAG: acyl-CoA thioesterase [Anaerolineae bacterium]